MYMCVCSICIYSYNIDQICVCICNAISYLTSYAILYAINVTCTHRSGRLPGPYVFTGKTLLSAGRPRQSVARAIGANFGLSKFCCFCKGNGTNYGSTSQGARSPVFTLIPFRSRVIWTGNHNIRPFVRIYLFTYHPHGTVVRLA